NAPDFETGANSQRVGIGGLRAGPDPPSLMFLRYNVAIERRSFGRRSHPLAIFYVHQWLRRGPGSEKRLNVTDTRFCALQVANVLSILLSRTCMWHAFARRLGWFHSLAHRAR